MIDATAILEQFRQGDIPNTWRVLYGPESTQRASFFMVRRPARWVKRSFLIMTPEGCVEYEGRKTVKSVAYADLKKIVLKMATSDESEGRRRTHTMAIMVMLALHYNDGRLELWRLDKRVGFAEEVAQQIITAHRRFQEEASQPI